jgi:hypothetical protein
LYLISSIVCNCIVCDERGDRGDERGIVVSPVMMEGGTVARRRLARLDDDMLAIIKLSIMYI